MRALLKDLLLTSKDGDWGPAEFSEGTEPRCVIRGTDFERIRFGDVSSAPVKFVKSRTVGRRTLEPGDVLIETAGGSAGQPTGRSVLLTEQVLGAMEHSAIGSSFTRFLRPDPKLLNPGYLFWWFQELYRSGEVYEHQVQHTGVARFQYTAFADSREIVLPRLEVQRAIAEVLGALDDKIAANERVASTAETLADALFHQSSSDISPGPSAFQDVASVEGGGTPKTKVEEYWGDDVAWATPTDVTQLSGLYLYDTSRKLTEAGLDACSSRLHPAGSILMTSRATIGALAIAAVPMAVNQGFIVANATDPDGQWWLYHEMKSRVPEFLNFANGATFMELPRGKFKQIPARWPGEEKLRSFNVAVSEIHERGRAAGVESASLARTRDELLPLLMSGKITVKDAEAVVSDAV